MRRDFLRTLFSRMLAAYITVTLGLIMIVGVTVVALFRAQLKTETEEQMIRETRQIADVLVKEPSAISDAQMNQLFQLFVEQSDSFLQIYHMDLSVSSYQSSDKWLSVKDSKLSESEFRQFVGGNRGVIENDWFGDLLTFPTISFVRPISDNGIINGIIVLHYDNSHFTTMVKTAWMEILLILLVAILLCTVVVYYTTARMTKPFMEINEIVQRYSKGDYNIRIPITRTEEATKLARSFNAMADQLNDLEATRRSFVANVSHELRSPLTSMKGFLEAMQDGTIGKDEHEKYLDIVLSETRRMTSMVNDLLDLARIESGKTAIRLEIFDINELIRRTLITFEARISDHQMEVEVKFAQEQSYVEADNAQISQVLRNLIDNAIKYSPMYSKLRIATYALRKEVYVSVQDNGQGIPEEDVPHVFDRFYKVEKAHTPTKQSGTGLGLSIVKKIIDQHGQTITLKSAKGKGSSFTFTLKRAPSPYKKQSIQDGGARYGV